MPARFAFFFSRVEAMQLGAYVRHRDDGADAGWYFGNKEQFEQRHKRILEELEKRDTASTGDKT